MQKQVKNKKTMDKGFRRETKLRESTSKACANKMQPTFTFLPKGGQVSEAMSHRGINSKVCQGILTVFSNANNTHLVFKSFNGSSFFKSSLGMLKNSVVRKKSTYANYLLGQFFGKKLYQQNIVKVDIVFKGFGRGHNDLLVGLREQKISFNNYFQLIQSPHNGCRPKKARRL